MSGQHSALFETYVRNLQRIYWVEFIETQTELLNARATAAKANPREPLAHRSCLASTYDYIRYRR